MEFINMTSTGKATIEVDVKEFNQMVLGKIKSDLTDKNGNIDYELCGKSKRQMELSNIFNNKHKYERYLQIMEIVTEVSNDYELQAKYAFQINIFDRYLDNDYSENLVRECIKTQAIWLHEEQVTS
jgi:hypothetical protein